MKTFLRHLPAGKPFAPLRLRRREPSIWQRRHFAPHVDYVHANPVKYNLVAPPGDWPYATVRGSAVLDRHSEA